jgi:hypothetical protein
VTATVGLLPEPTVGTPSPAEPAGIGVTLLSELEAHEPPEVRGASRADVRLMVSRTAAREISHHTFAELPDLLLPGDLVVVNNSATLPAAVAVVATPPSLSAARPRCLTAHGLLSCEPAAARPLPRSAAARPG